MKYQTISLQKSTKSLIFIVFFFYFNCFFSESSKNRWSLSRCRYQRSFSNYLIINLELNWIFSRYAALFTVDFFILCLNVSIKKKKVCSHDTRCSGNFHTPTILSFIFPHLHFSLSSAPVDFKQNCENLIYVRQFLCDKY